MFLGNSLHQNKYHELVAHGIVDEIIRGYCCLLFAVRSNSIYKRWLMWLYFFKHSHSTTLFTLSRLNHSTHILIAELTDHWDRKTTDTDICHWLTRAELCCVANSDLQKTLLRERVKWISNNLEGSRFGRRRFLISGSIQLLRLWLVVSIRKLQMIRNGVSNTGDQYWES